MDPAPRSIEKRNRRPVSCEQCRLRKLKCNRGLPCENCIKRNKQSLCHYAANANRANPTASKQKDMKARLNTLEKLVSSFLSGNAVVHPASGANASVRASDGMISPSTKSSFRLDGLALTPNSEDQTDTSLVSETPHVQETGDGQVNYIDKSHWQSILEDIQEVREHISAANQQKELNDVEDRVLHDASYLFDSVPSATYAEILTSLPSQPIYDKLLAKYFTSGTYVTGIVHPVKFREEYERFWKDPMSAPPLWTALVFSMLSVMAASHTIFNPTEVDRSIPPLHDLQRRAAQCLMLGKYATANEYALEAFVLHLLSYMLSQDQPAVNLWFELGTIIRLAFRMGYHRDPSRLPRVSAFDGEMRRRLWLNIVQLDSLMSYQTGFPSMIPSECCDTRVPSNLEYSDLRRDMTTVPPGRALSEQTPVRYSISKHPVMLAFKRIVGHTQSLLLESTVDSYTKITSLHDEMNGAYDRLPDVLKSRDVSRSFLDTSKLMIERATIENVFHKALIILHRRFISYEARIQGLDHSHRSRNTCIEAALAMLHRQADLFEACDPGGRLYDDRWMVYTLPVHDWLLAAMTICLDLSISMQLQKPETETTEQLQLQRREYEALEVSRKIWVANSAGSSEAHIASLALGLMIRKVDEHRGVVSATSAQEPLQENYVTGFSPDFQFAGAMSQMIDGSDSVDWALLDHYLYDLDGLNTEGIM
ncbi:fungal-specific transcription factor domain-containing protein [Xylariaceae sp. FL1019]|nr:fungal-specific transcription factor domain-containing protein [Xylariaceae sp. FL1019]